MSNSWFTKQKQIELANELTDAQQKWIAEAIKLGFNDQEITMKLRIHIGFIAAYRNCIEQGWL